MALWQKIKQLDITALRGISNLYSLNSIPIEARDFFSEWIEASIKELKPEAFATGLIVQIQEKLLSLTGSTENRGDDTAVPFYVVQRLSEFQNSLLRIPTNDLHRRFLSCLEAEKLIAKQGERFNLDSQAIYQQALTSSVKSVSSEICPSPNMNASRETSDEKVTDCQIEQPPQQGPPETEFEMPPDEQRQCQNFLNNPLRIIIDSDVNKILEAVWSLEEANNMLAFKFNQMKSVQDLRNQQLKRQAKPSEVTQDQIYVEAQELYSQINEIRNEIFQQATTLFGQISEIRRRIPVIIQNWTQLKSALLTGISEWTQQQRLSANGRPMTKSLVWIKTLAEYLMGVMWKLRHFLQRSEKVCQANARLVDDASSRNIDTVPLISEQLVTITQLIRQLVQNTFLVVHQPCQILKTNTRLYKSPGQSQTELQMEVQLLVGGPLGLQLTPPSVSVSIVDEKTCRDIEIYGLGGNKFHKVSKKEKLSPESTNLTFKQETGCSSAVFQHISLKDFSRNFRKGAAGKEVVTDEKLCLLFRSEFTVGDIKFQIWKFSLPIVIITHGSQECSAWAVLTWDNEFSQAARIPFEVTEYANWTSVRDMLNHRFYSIVGAQLTEENLSYLTERFSTLRGYPDRISWTELCKSNLPSRKFAMWQWFFKAAELIKQHLAEAWKDGYVSGFVGKDYSENILRSSGCSPGTFLFRFSESVLGGISIVWLHSDGKAYSLKPLFSKDLATLVEKLNQDTLHYVYPNTPKSIAFKKYYEDYQAAKTADAILEARSYVRFRSQLVIDNPTIPKFCLLPKTQDKAGLQTGSLDDKTSHNPAEIQLEEPLIDFDKIFSDHTTQEEYGLMGPSLEMWIPSVSSAPPAEGGNGDKRSTVKSREIISSWAASPEENVYFPL